MTDDNEQQPGTGRHAAAPGDIGPDTIQQPDQSGAQKQSRPGRYQFHELIATGGMGEVWRATDTNLGRDVAIKLLKPEYADDPVNRQRFDSEARHAAALHHSHVAAVYDVGEMPTASGLMRPYLVMELVDGKPLSDLLRDGRPLDPEVVRDLLGQAGDALAAAHRAGIVHRDVKPANLLVTPDRQVKVTDFGIARAASSSAITSTGQVMGTPQYLSPEQARGETATSASDVYALGVVAFECLAGYRPFQKETPVATAIAHLHDPVPPLPDDVPPDLAAVVMKALAKDPASRYPDAAAFTAALRGRGGVRTDTSATIPVVGAPIAAAAGEQSPATAVLPTVTGGAPAGPSPQRAPVPEQEPRRPWYKNPLNIVLLVLLILAVIAVIWLISFINGSGDDAPTTATQQPTTSAPPARHHKSTEPAQPKTFDLDESQYVGRNVDDVLAELRNMGLRPHTEVVHNDGRYAADTVAALHPTRNLRSGDRILVRYYGSAPEPSTTPTPTETPTPTQTPSPGGSGSPSPSDSTSPEISLLPGVSESPSPQDQGNEQGAAGRILTP